jgi:hypothetical protein
MSHWPLWFGKLTADRGDSDGKNAKTMLADWIRLPYGLIPCISYTCCYFQFQLQVSRADVGSDLQFFCTS